MPDDNFSKTQNLASENLGPRDGFFQSNKRLPLSLKKINSTTDQSTLIRKSPAIKSDNRDRRKSIKILSLIDGSGINNDYDPSNKISSDPEEHSL